MTGPEHYREAERLMEEAWELEAEPASAELPSTRIAAAQVHATLALAAATALNDNDPNEGGMPLDDFNQWRETVGINLQKEAS